MITSPKSTALIEQSTRSEDAGDADSEQSMWQQFADATTTEDYCTTWLALQCRIIQGVERAIALLGSTIDNQPFAPAAYWPDRKLDFQNLTPIAERTLRERRGVVLKQARKSDGGDPHSNSYHIGYPIEVANRVFAVVALDLNARSQSELDDALRQLEWGGAWLEVLWHRRDARKEMVPQARLQAAVDLLATVAAQERFQGAAVAFATALATRLGCDRVSVGFVRDGKVRVEALSHSAQFGKDSNLIHAIGTAMEEAVDQNATVLYPNRSAAHSQITRAHQELARQYGNRALCSVPLAAYGKLVGVMTLERSQEEMFDRESTELCEAVAALAGPVLEIQRRENRSLGRKVSDACRTRLQQLIGPDHMALKLGVFGVVLLLLLLVFVNGDYRVTAKTVIEPSTRRAMVAAFNGYVAEAPARAGDLVRRDQLLCRLDDRELKLERSKWFSQQEQSMKQLYEAHGGGNAAQVQILTAQVDQAKAQVALIDDQLARTQVVAPFDGVVVAGDLSQSLGSPVERGQVLFEVAPLESYRIILQVDERAIGDVVVGQRGHIVLSGTPHAQLPISIEKMTPVSTASEGRNYFRVEAKFQGKAERLRPGMEGIGKIEIDRRRWIWIWTHDVVDWLRLKLWEWLP